MCARRHQESAKRLIRDERMASDALERQRQRRVQFVEPTRAESPRALSNRRGAVQVFEDEDEP